MSNEDKPQPPYPPSPLKGEKVSGTFRARTATFKNVSVGVPVTLVLKHAELAHLTERYRE